MTLTARTLLVLGALNAALAVALGAYGAHALDAQAPAALFHTAVQYHMLHALGLIALGVIAAQRTGVRLVQLAGGLMLFGILCFCGTLYFTAIAGYRGLNILTPFGGTAFILAWLCLAVAVTRRAPPI